MDKLRKSFDQVNWKTMQIVFDIINNLWLPLTKNRFTNYENSKTKKFNSKILSSIYAGVVIFKHHWSNEMNYLVPPVFLIGDQTSLKM